MNPETPHIFFRSQPMVCPYLEKRIEYQLFTRINRPLSNVEAMYFSNSGFRRSHNIMYRPVCPDCSACISTRVFCKNFHYKPTWRRIFNKNKDLTSTLITDITYEQYELFRQYVSSRHSSGEMANMSFQEYADMIIQSPMDTCLIEYRSSDNHLVATCILDKFSDGFSAIYSFYNTFLAHRSLGSFMILDLVMRLQKQNLPYLYLGYWVDGSRKMNYKKRFYPLEGYIDNEWKLLQ